MNSYTTVINFLVSIPLECRTASLFILYAGKRADGDRTQLNLWRRKRAHEQLQMMLRRSPVAFLSQARGPTKLRSSCYTKTGFYTISLLKQSSLPPKNEYPKLRGCVHSYGLSPSTPGQQGHSPAPQQWTAEARHGRNITDHLWRKRCVCAQMIRKTLHVLY